MQDSQNMFFHITGWLNWLYKITILKYFRGNYNLIAMLTNLVDKTCFFI